MTDQITGLPADTAVAKAQAKRLRSVLAETGLTVQHGQALELVARLHGQESWGHLNACLDEPAPPRAPAEPRPDPILPGMSAARLVRTLLGPDFKSTSQMLQSEMITALMDCLDLPRFRSLPYNQFVREPRHPYAMASHADVDLFLDEVDVGALRAGIERTHQGDRRDALFARLPGLARRDGVTRAEVPSGVPEERRDVAFAEVRGYQVLDDVRAGHTMLIAHDADAAESFCRRLATRSDYRPSDDLPVPESLGLPVTMPDTLLDCDRLRWLIATSYARGLPGTAGSGRPMPVLLRQNRMEREGVDVLHAQARGCGLHLCTWMTEPETTLTNAVLAQTATIGLAAGSDIPDWLSVRAGLAEAGDGADGHRIASLVLG